MARYTPPITQEFTDAGAPLVGGKLEFLASGTENQLDTYSDEDLTIANANPVILDAAGRTGNIWMQDTAYKVRQYDADDVLVWEADPYTGDSSKTYDDWSATIAYGVNDIVVGSDGLLYISIQASNLNQDPTSTPTYWSRLLLTTEWNTNQTYASGDMALYDGVLYESQAASNQGNNPATDTTNWSTVGQSVGTWTPDLTDLTNSASYTSREGTYTKIGRVIYWTCYLDISSLGSLSGALYIDGLPEASATISGNSYGPGSWTAGTGLVITAGYSATCSVLHNNRELVDLLYWDSTFGASRLAAAEVKVGDMTWAGWYLTD